MTLYIEMHGQQNVKKSCALIIILAVTEPTYNGMTI